MAVLWPAFFSKLVCRNPYFYSVFWVRVFWAKLSKMGILGPKNNREFWRITQKSCFAIFICCNFFISFFFVFCFVYSFFGGRRFKGQVRWPKGPSHLATNPLLFFWVSFVLFSFWFVSFVVFRKNLCFLWKKGISFFFSVSFGFSLVCFSLPRFHSLFLCLSLSLLFFSSILIFLHICFILFPLFFALFLCFFALFLCFCSWKEQHQNIIFYQSFQFFGFLSFLVFQIPFS